MTSPSAGPTGLVCAALVAIAAAGCGAAPTVVAPSEEVAPPADPAQFNADRFEANQRDLAALWTRRPPSEAAEAVRQWTRANVAPGAPNGAIALAAPIAAREAEEAGLSAQTSGLALTVEVARALAAGGQPVHVATIESASSSDPQLAGASVAVYVKRACGTPQRRDLLSDRVLRERFFAIAGVDALEFEQSDAPHDALLAAGARRVVVLDAPPREGGSCQPGSFGDALVRFVRDASRVLARGRVNSAPPATSEPGP